MAVLIGYAVVLVIFWSLGLFIASIVGLFFVYIVPAILKLLWQLVMKFIN